MVLASLFRVRFGECLLSEFLQSEHLVGWEVQEVWGILWLKVEYAADVSAITVSRKLGTVDTLAVTAS